MARSMVWRLGIGAWLAAGLCACGGGNPCEELREEVCARCPDDEQGNTARLSCLGAADSGDERACEARLEQRTYEAFGCR